MPEEIQKFDPATLMQGVKDRIKATFVSLIPDEQWDVMVQKEIDSFFSPEPGITIAIRKQPTKEQSGWNTSYENVLVVEGRVSPFQRIVIDMCIEKTVQELQKYLTEEKLHGHWAFDKYETDKELQGLIELAIPKAVTNFFQSMAFMATASLRNDIQNHRM
jgi:hypothetical protein